MQVFKSEKDLNAYLINYRKSGSSIGFVPTMGALHDGHLSLLNLSKSDNEISIVSIFVNPLQFNSIKDLQLYPRPLEMDIELLEKAGCDALFIPSEKDMYVGQVKTTLSFGQLGDVLEGKFRSGHFSGVGIVVTKLFNIVKPQKAYFGQKDLQQLAIIKQMVKDLSIPVKLVTGITLREYDGLAMSSRNRRISALNRPLANRLYLNLENARNLLGEMNIAEVKRQVIETFLKQEDFSLEYFEVVDSETFAEVKNLKDHTTIALCIAAYLEDIRLIDNILVNVAELPKISQNI